mmetsp:Transcript_44616/g.142203  ORF Transcript_44616/g.142203 Transcript_44616/m.142203 type:complete len:253 (+) Transcript_44616:106-864(+)
MYRWHLARAGRRGAARRRGPLAQAAARRRAAWPVGRRALLLARGGAPPGRQLDPPVHCNKTSSGRWGGGNSQLAPAQPVHEAAAGRIGCPVGLQSARSRAQHHHQRLLLGPLRRGLRDQRLQIGGALQLREKGVREEARAGGAAAGPRQGRGIALLLLRVGSPQAAFALLALGPGNAVAPRVRYRRDRVQSAHHTCLCLVQRVLLRLIQHACRSAGPLCNRRVLLAGISPVHQAGWAQHAGSLCPAPRLMKI